ncbi:MAG: META domain-containing protein [Dehalococcoidia bacterium]
MSKRWKPLVIPTVVLISLLVAVSCSDEAAPTPRPTPTPTPTVPAGQGSLGQSAWKLTSYGPIGEPTPLIEGSEVTAEFDESQGTISGSAGCNSYFGSLATETSTISIGEMAWTERFCVEPEGIMEQEQDYLTALGNAESFELEDGELRVFYGEDGVQIFTAR